MALLESAALALGTTMPDFQLEDAYGDLYSNMSAMGERGLLLFFTCNHCPYAIAVWDRLINLSQLAHSVQLGSVAINPNIHPDYPEDSPDKMGELIVKKNIKFPYLVDAKQETARVYHAECTPDIYLLNPKMQLVYHGRIDDNWKDESSVTKQDLKEAILALGNNKPITVKQYPSMGCSIKWQNA